MFAPFPLAPDCSEAAVPMRLDARIIREVGERICGPEDSLQTVQCAARALLAMPGPLITVI